jgi:hypothetical protein
MAPKDSMCHAVVRADNDGGPSFDVSVASTDDWAGTGRSSVVRGTASAMWLSVVT